MSHMNIHGGSWLIILQLQKSFEYMIGLDEQVSKAEQHYIKEVATNGIARWCSRSTKKDYMIEQTK